VEDSLPRTPLSERGKRMEEKTILIVEDDDACRSAMEKVLQSHNYKTFSCASGKHALMKLREKLFGILITDYQMRGMDGLELIKETRKIHPGISSILVSGVATEGMSVRANEQGVNGFFPKPIEWDELIGLLDALTREQRNRRGNKGIMDNDDEPPNHFKIF